MTDVRSALRVSLAAALAVAASAAAAQTRPFLERHLPPSFLEEGPRGLAWWQWLAIPGLALVAIAAGWILGWVTRLVLARLAARTRTSWDDELIDRVGPPLTLLWSVGVATSLLPWLALPDVPGRVAAHVLRAFTYLAFFWAGLRSINLAFAFLRQSPWAKQNAGFLSQLPVGRKIAKVALLGFGLVAVLNELGFQVASLLAGLGIGGIALALAAQKTVENVFGSVSIGVDQPFRIGDFVKVEDVVGTVETIGMRSTRFRTLERTLVTIPNGKLADMKIETFAVRDRLRLYANVGLVYSTTATQMRAVLEGIEALLRRHPRIFPDGISVRFSAFTDSSLNVEVACWFATADWNEFTAIRQEVFLGILELVERAGTSMAFPTRTVHLVPQSPDAGREGAERERARHVSAPGPRIGGADRDRTDDL
jgi:MscS family membrane protein